MARSDEDPSRTFSNFADEQNAWKRETLLKRQWLKLEAEERNIKKTCTFQPAGRVPLPNFPEPLYRGDKNRAAQRHMLDAWEKRGVTPFSKNARARDAANQTEFEQGAGAAGSPLANPVS